MTGLNEEDLKKNVKDKDTWLRFVYLVVIAVFFYASVLATLAFAILQFFSKLFSGSSFTSLAEIGENLALYQAQCSRYLTFASDERPFPFVSSPFKRDDTPTIL